MTSSRVVADAILAGSADAIIATDRGGVIQIWNAGAAQRN
jgi:signal transduction histidine kinase